jgi:hypothetical protein
MRFAIYQAQISREAIDKINAVGWDGDFGEYEAECRIQRDVKFMGGSEKYTPDMAEHYFIVGLCDAADLDEVFHIGNVDHDRLQLVAERMHSISVGDIIHDNDTGDCFMVDPEGFSKVWFEELA